MALELLSQLCTFENSTVCSKISLLLFIEQKQMTRVSAVNSGRRYLRVLVIKTDKSGFTISLSFLLATANLITLSGCASCRLDRRRRLTIMKSAMYLSSGAAPD